jgi:hypothetical protein
MDRERLLVELTKLVAERQRIDGELDRILALVGKWSPGLAPRRGRPPGARSATVAPKPRATRKKRGLSRGSLASRIVVAVQKSGRPMSAQEVSAAVGDRRVPAVSSTMNRLKATGYLKRVGRGRYRAS